MAFGVRFWADVKNQKNCMQSAYRHCIRSLEISRSSLVLRRVAFSTHSMSVWDTTQSRIFACVYTERERARADERERHREVERRGGGGGGGEGLRERLSVCVDVYMNVSVCVRVCVYMKVSVCVCV